MRLSHVWREAPVSSFVISVGGLGLIPRGKATFGTIAGALLFKLVSPEIDYQIIILILLVILGMIATTHVLHIEPKAKDPQWIVIDEVIGVWIALLCFDNYAWSTIVFSVITFRTIDKMKLWPIRKLEKLNGATGIIVDDMLAGVYANIILRFAFFLFGLINV